MAKLTKTGTGKTLRLKTIANINGVLAVRELGLPDWPHVGKLSSKQAVKAGDFLSIIYYMVVLTMKMIFRGMILNG